MIYLMRVFEGELRVDKGLLLINKCHETLKALDLSMRCLF
ncbi:hypothetical protein AJ85_18685 [Alkalihalobacillus alcalophilus ATCC 27647 = CGMCC 1.3604]|uniref:Uncharacterized protein n=1 Tax=Alkalihalobacillus alcalophilus ATCC 27647 = CGMCC 1.3604 TaxID=1218173 RepID=A0A4S4JVW2_ALKAL|nr:hypothetical protein AJ85_18685 [Alkalihalobacillus alcalophilus ATCC 27647 = CGMCC 1.3604]